MTRSLECSAKSNEVLRSKLEAKAVELERRTDEVLQLRGVAADATRGASQVAFGDLSLAFTVTADSFLPDTLTLFLNCGCLQCCSREGSVSSSCHPCGQDLGRWKNP